MLMGFDLHQWSSRMEWLCFQWEGRLSCWKDHSMCKSNYPIVVLVWVLSIFSLLMLNAPRSVEAQSLGEMSCDDLWFARNQIYAQNGHCFKTRRGRSVFGRNCFPPYGQLNSGEQRRIARIQQQERRMACGSGGRTAPSSRRNRLIYPSMSCSALWYERNAIFARNGHCFKSLCKTISCWYTSCSRTSTSSCIFSFVLMLKNKYTINL